MKKTQIIITLIIAIAIIVILCGYITKREVIILIGVIFAFIPLVFATILNTIGSLNQIRIEKQNPVVYFDEGKGYYHVDKNCALNDINNPEVQRLKMNRKEILVCPVCGLKEIEDYFYKEGNK